MYPDTLWVMTALVAFLNLLIALVEPKNRKINILLFILLTLLCIARIVQWKIAGVM